MGTSLTGLTPATTYDALIKVGDNGPLSATAKVLSDGLGNDSPLAMSTSRVGIGTTSPDTTLDVNGGSKFRGSISGFTGAEILLNGGNNSQVALSTNGTGSTEMYFDQRGSSTGIWKFRDTTDVRMAIIGGNVGIGTSSPNAKLEVAGTSANTDFRISRTVDPTANLFITAPGGATLTSIFGISGTDIFSIDTNKYIRLASASGGIQFNGDTAAANALDDYEEGTFTPTTAGDATGAFSSVVGEYTKIGNVVNFRLIAQVTANFSSNTIGGLPFTIGGSATPSGVNSSINIANDNTANLNGFPVVGTSNIIIFSDHITTNAINPSTGMGILRMFGTYRV